MIARPLVRIEPGRVRLGQLTLAPVPYDGNGLPFYRAAWPRSICTLRAPGEPEALREAIRHARIEGWRVLEKRR